MKRLARHRVHGEIASGGMATVYLASFAAAGAVTSVTAALKRLHPHLAKEPEFRTMLLEEARLSARVVHANVVRTLAVLEEGDDVVIAMEYALGLTLIESVQRALERAGSVDPAIASGIVVGMLHGLDAAHRAMGADGAPLGIVHRDVSPQNVIVGADGVPRLLDFGIAKARNRLSTTEEGVARGKQGYMAPEQLTGEPLGRATDIFAAGVVLWELIAGERLFEPDDVRSSFARRIRDDVTARPSALRPSDAATVAPAVDDVILRSLRRQPQERFASAREMADALAAVVAPASEAEIAAWLERIAGEDLATLRARVAEVERIAAESDDGTLYAGEDTLEFDPWLPRGIPIARALATTPLPRPRRFLDAVIAVCLIAVAVAIIGKVTMQAARAASPAGPRSSLESASLTPAEAITSQPSLSGSGPAPSSGLPLATPLLASTSPAPVSTIRRPSAAGPVRSKKCSPPYTFDRDGHKLYKLECY